MHPDANRLKTGAVPSSTPADPPETPRHLPLLPIFLIVLVDVLGLTIVFPLLPLYAESFGATALVAALLVPAYAACQLLAGPLLGSWSDRVGRRRVLLISQAGTLLGFLMIASAQSLWVLFVGRILDGLTAGNLTVAQAYIADNTAPKDRAKSFALIGIAFGLGFMVGPALGGYLSHWGMGVPLYLAAGLSALSILCTWRLLPKEAAPPAALRKPGASVPAEPLLPAGRRLSVLDVRQYAKYFRRPVLNGLLLEFFLYLFSFSMFMSGFALFAERRYSYEGEPFTAPDIGWVFALAGLVGVIVQGGLLGRLVRRFGEVRLITVGLIALGVGYSLLAHVEPWAPLAAATVVSAFGNALLRPNLTSLVTQIVERHEQGIVLGLTQSLASLAQISAAPFSGWLIGAGHLDAWSWVAGGVCVLCLLAGRWGSAAFEAAPPARPVPQS